MSEIKRSEFQFIRELTPHCVVQPEDVVLGIGDDAAVFRQRAKLLGLMTTDLLIEQVHFLRRAMDGHELGHKALAVNLSDIAAMGGTARDAYVSLGVPVDCTDAYLDALMAGLKELAARYHVNVLGGDTTRSMRDLVINVAVRGEVAEPELLRRDTARVGDVVFCTGHLGDSRAGLHMIINDITADTPLKEALRRAHVCPEPHLDEGRFLACRPECRTAIDVSDGVSSDLGHIAEASGVGLRLFSEHLPLSDALKAFCADEDLNAVDVALHGGEDYVLAGTLARSGANGVAEAFHRTFGKPLYLIGEVAESGTMEWTDARGTPHPLAPRGWDHFRSTTGGKA